MSAAVSHPCVSGDVKRLPAGRGWRTLQALTLVLPVRGLLDLGARSLLAYRHQAKLTLLPAQLRLEATKQMFGRVIQRAESLYPLEEIREISLETQGEPPGFHVGLMALGAGTLLGGWLFADGVRAGAGSLLAAASILLILGVITDFFVGSGRKLGAWRGPSRLLVRAKTGGFVLAALPDQAASALFDAVGEQLENPPVTAPSSPPT